MQAFLAQLAPVMPDLFTALLSVLGLILTWIIGAVASKVKEWVGVQIDEKHLRTLHSAILTGVRRAIEAKLPQASVTGAAVMYATQSAPDAIKALKASGGVLQSLAQAKLQEVIGTMIDARTRDLSQIPAHLQARKDRP